MAALPPTLTRLAVSNLGMRATSRAELMAETLSQLPQLLELDVCGLSGDGTWAVLTALPALVRLISLALSVP